MCPFFRASLSSSCSGGRLSSQGHSDGEGRPPQRLYAKRDTRKGDAKRESKKTHQGGIKPASHFNERRKSIGQPGSRQPSLRYLTPKVESISLFHFTYVQKLYLKSACCCPPVHAAAVPAGWRCAALCDRSLYAAPLGRADGPCPEGFKGEKNL